jgi:uncharacterized membrane protein SpoIIM required for sporulation
MDIDRYVAEHEPVWQRLAVLARQARHPKHLGPSELDELLSLYQRTSANLSYVRTAVDDPALIGRLTRLVATAHGAIYGQPIRGRRSVRRFFTEAFPGALWHQRWFVVVATALTFVPALALGVWIAHSPRAYEATAPAALREAYVQDDFEAYYSSEPAVQFASEVFTNNVRVAAFAFAAGILLCVLTAWILVQNGLNLGLAAGLFAVAGQQPRFWGLIIPHGLIELSAVIVAGAAGLRLGWTVIDPGDRTRGTAIAEEGRRAGLVLMGVVLMLAVAGTIEGFVTGRGTPTAVRVVLGIAVAGAFWTYIVMFGRRAIARERTELVRAVVT